MTTAAKPAETGSPDPTGPGDLKSLRLRLPVPTLVLSGSLMAVVSSLGAPLIPTLAQADGVSLSTGEWILTITLLTGALATPVMGRLADGPGQRAVILVALVALVAVVVGCVVSAVSSGFTVLLIGRALQGVGLGLLPVAMATARRNLPPEQARRTIATLSVTTAIGAGLGYPVTGLIGAPGRSVRGLALRAEPPDQGATWAADWLVSVWKYRPVAAGAPLRSLIVAFEYLSDEQSRRYGAFVADPSPEELERFFFLDARALELARTKRRRHNRLGWAVQWGTVRMLGTFLEDPLDVPRVVVDYAAEQLGVDDPSCVKEYAAERVQTKYEHAWEIRDLLGFRDFDDGAEAGVTAFIASRVAMTRDSRRELFDRAALWLIENRVLLPGLSTLSRLVTETRRIQPGETNDDVAGAAPVHMRRELLGTLAVPDGKRISVLEWMRTPVVKLSGTGMTEALDRASYVLGLGTGAVDLSAVAPVKLAELASYGMHAKAPKIADLKGARRVATLVATVRQLEGSAVDDALLLFDLLMSTRLLSAAARQGDKEKLRTLPRLRTAAARMAAAWSVVLGTLPGEGRDVSLPEVMSAVEQVVSRQDLAAAVEAVAELLPQGPADADDGDAEWRAALTGRYPSPRRCLQAGRGRHGDQHQCPHQEREAVAGQAGGRAASGGLRGRPRRGGRDAAPHRLPGTAAGSERAHRVPGCHPAHLRVRGPPRRLDISLAALLVAQSCNIGLTPVAKPGVPALTESRADRYGEGLLPRSGHRRRLRPPGGLPGRDRHHR